MKNINFREWLDKKDEGYFGNLWNAALGREQQPKTVYHDPRDDLPPSNAPNGYFSPNDPQMAQKIQAFVSQPPNTLSGNAQQIRVLWDKAQGFFDAYSRAKNPKIKQFFGEPVRMLVARLNAIIVQLPNNNQSQQNTAA